MQSLNRMTTWNQARKQETSQYIGNCAHIWTFADTQYALVGGASPASWTRWAKPLPRKKTPFFLHLIHLFFLLFSIMCSNWQMSWLKTGSVNHTWCFPQHCLGVGCWSHIAKNSTRLFGACHSDAKTEKWQTWGGAGRWVLLRDPETWSIQWLTNHKVHKSPLDVSSPFLTCDSDFLLPGGSGDQQLWPGLGFWSLIHFSTTASLLEIITETVRQEMMVA